MRKTLYLFVSFCTLLFAACADRDAIDSTLPDNGGKGVKVSMSLEGEMQGDNASHAAGAKATRAIGYETDDNSGAPVPIGIFDKGLNDGKEIASGTKVPVLLILRSTDDSQPVTKVVTQWTYTQGGSLALEPSETFEMKAGTDLSKGTWYVCGILGGEMLVGNNQVKFNGYSEGHNSRSVSGQKVTWGANIPYVFSWRKVDTNAANKTIKSTVPVRFKQFGTIVRLRITNKTGFNIKYNGVRIITSNILCGQFDLTSFDDKNLVKSSDLHDTQDSEIASAKSSTYENAFKAFKFYQRPLSDNTMTGGAQPDNGWIKTKRFRIHGNYIPNYNDEKNGTTMNTALYYYDHTFETNSSGTNFDKVANNSDAPSYVYVWMYPQKQSVAIYNGREQGVGDSIVKKVSKTQFMLMAVPDDNGSATGVVPSSINMLPAYGTTFDYKSGANYPARGQVVYHFAPLSYLAKHDNFGTAAQLESEANQDVAHTERYSYADVQSRLSTIPAGYMFANHEYWRSIIPQAYGFSAFRKKDGGAPYYKYAVGIVSPAKLPGWSDTKLVFQSSSKANTVNGKTYAYMIGMSKKPDYITDDTEGQVYQGRAKTASGEASSGITTPLSWIQNNDYRYTIRWEDVNGNAVLTQRYLGPRFILDMDDIDNEDFWADPSNGTTYPADVKREIPQAGAYVFATTMTNTTPSSEWRYWYLLTDNQSAQYWTPDDAVAGGRYAMRSTTGSGGFNPDGLPNPPKQVVGFRIPVLSANLSSFFYYGYTGTPGNNAQPRSWLTTVDADKPYVQGLVMKIPVRLWRSATPFAN